MSQLLIDLVNNGGGVQTALVPQTLNASAQGASIDGQNMDVSTNAVVSVGAYGANTTTLQVQVEESTTGTGSWTVIPGMVATVTTSNTQVIVRGQRTYQYLRANAVSVQGTTPSVALSVVIVSQGKFCPQDGGFSNYPST